MAELIAQGPSAEHRWRRELLKSTFCRIGRAEGWEVPWDKAISFEHASLEWDGFTLQVKRLPDARNPIFFKGSEIDSFHVRPGEHFVVGQTVFTLSNEQVDVTLDAPVPQTQQQFSAMALKQAKFRDVDLRLNVLMQLPDLVDYAVDDKELFQRLANVLLAGAIQAEAVGIVVLAPAAKNEESNGLTVLKWDRRRVTGQPFVPSQRLVSQAITSNETVLYEWNQASGAGKAITMADNTTWAVACPIAGQHTSGWCLYLTGSDSSEPTTTAASLSSRLQDDIKFTEMVASMLAKLIKLRSLQRDRTTLAQFFSPLVLDAVVGKDPEEVLQPRETVASVLFCDLRGFSRRSEEQADDLMGLLNRVSQVLGVTTEAILEHGGVVGDFHGDAAMGFWGWPVTTGTEIEQACRAALSIRHSLSKMRKQGHQTLAQFQMGLGLATGPAVAGKIGTKDQVKVTAFGPVVNLAARLESMTRQLKAPVLIDEVTARTVREKLSTQVCRARRLAVVQPFGMNETVEVNELLPPFGEESPLTDEQLNAYEQAWESMVSGDWNAAFEWLHHVPSDDRAKDFLTVYIAQHDRTPPPDWEGYIVLSQK